MNLTEYNKDKVGARITQLLTEMIAIPTTYPPGHSTHMAYFIADTLNAAGYTVETLARKKGFDNVVARLGKGEPSLVFNAHIDTVGAGDLSLWQHPPFQAHQQDGMIFGLGAANCKGSAAVQLWLAEEVARCGGPANGEIVFTFVTDEESLDCNGMAYLRETGAIRPDMLLLGAPTDNSLIVTERGVLWVEIKTRGKPAHAGEPEAGDNAISRMIRVCSAIEQQMHARLVKRIDGEMRSTMNLGLFQGGVNTNVVPSQCRVEIDRRLLPEESVESAFAELREIVAAVGEPEGTVSISQLRGTKGFVGDKNGRLVTALRQSIRAQSGSDASFSSAIGVSDGRYFADDGIEIVNFGPGIGSVGHACNESVEVSKLLLSAEILVDCVDQILGLGKGENSASDSSII